MTVCVHRKRECRTKHNTQMIFASLLSFALILFTPILPDQRRLNVHNIDNDYEQYGSIIRLTVRYTRSDNASALFVEM